MPGILDNFIGRIRLPEYTQLTIDTRSGNTVMTYVAQSEDGRKTTFTREYPGKIMLGQALMDLLQWLKHSATTFYGSASGGL